MKFHGVVVLAAVLLFIGCYSFSGSTLPSRLHTLHIYPIENRTLESSLPDRINRGLADGFRQRSSLRQVNEGGDAEIIGTLLQYSHAPQSTSGDQVTTYRVDLLFKVLFIDRVQGDTLYKDEAIPGYGFYAPEKGETEEIARQRAIDNLVKVVLDNTVLAW